MNEHIGNTKKGGAAASALLVLLIIWFFTLLSDINESPSALCDSCHTMTPYYYTWQVSSHGSLSCLSCHKGAGIKGNIRFGKDMVRYIYRQATQTYILPIRIFSGLSDEACMRCHTFNRLASLPGDLIIPHEDHSKKNVRCVACHVSVTHGNIGRRRTTVTIPANSWNRLEGKRQMSQPFRAPPKEGCMSCHFNLRLELTCDSCHSEDKVPPSHHEKDFLSTHGTQAQEIEGCQRCHAYDNRGKKITVQLGGNLKAYTRQNDFCRDCHGKMPGSHLPDFRRHGDVAKENKGKCMICHDNQPQADYAEVTDLYCGACHPSPHKKGWQERHTRRRRAPIIPGAGIQDSCFSCHGARCLSCHPPPGIEEY
jgi:hypothetical protein